MKRHRPSTRHLIATTLTIAAFASGSIGLTGSAGAVSSTEVDVMAWLAAVSPAITVDHTTNCMPGPTPMATHSTDAVAYRNDRIVMRSSAPDNSVKLAVNKALNTMYTTNNNYVGPIERITFPTPPGGLAIVHVLSITLLPRLGGVQHDILGLARKLRNESHMTVSPDYAVEPSTPYGYYWPHGYPRKISALTPPRTNQTPATPAHPAQPIGSGVKVEVYDTGQFAPDPINLPTTTKLSSSDNDLVNLVQNGPSMVDFPAAGHATAIAGVLTTMTPGATIEDVRINDRTGLATDVSAARGMASSLRTLPLAGYPNLIVNAFGSPACELNPAAPGAVLEPIGLEAVVEVVDKFDPVKPGGMLIIASAGNMATTRPHYPAAFPSVLGVGALDATIDSDGNPWTSLSKNAPIADFSNRGPWVKVYTPGVALPTTHVNGYRFEDGGDIIQGIAEVDGTSFSGPVMTSYLAEVMSITGNTARVAKDALITGKPHPLQCGSSRLESGAAIALSVLTAKITDPPTNDVVTC